jgi:hypothetical protein
VDEQRHDEEAAADAEEPREDADDGAGGQRAQPRVAARRAPLRVRLVAAVSMA